MNKKKRVSILEAKNIFKKRTLRSRVKDRQKTSRHLVYPYSKNSWKWKQNPSKYDMHLVDTKTIVPEKIINGRIYTLTKKVKDLNKAKSIRREILASYSNNIFVPDRLNTNQLQKKSSMNVKYKKIKGGYGLYIRPKKGGVPFAHPVILEGKGRGLL